MEDLSFKSSSEVIPRKVNILTYSSEIGVKSLGVYMHVSESDHETLEKTGPAKPDQSDIPSAMGMHLSSLWDNFILDITLLYMSWYRFY